MNEQTLSAPVIIKEVVGTPVVVKSGEPPMAAIKGVSLNANDLLFTPEGSGLILAVNNEFVAIDDNCIGCITIASNETPTVTTAQVEGTLILDDQPGDAQIDVAAIQDAIADGADPTETLEAAAAGEGPEGSALGTSGTVTMLLNETIAATLFETAAQRDEKEQFDYEGARTIAFAEGGLTLLSQVSEGSLFDGTYPQVTVTQATVIAGTLALEPSSFVPNPERLSAVLQELNSEVTSSGEPVEFVYDPGLNAIVGTQGGEAVVTIDIDATLVDKDINLTLTTTVEKPIDHNVDSGSEGLVRFTDNLLQVDLTIDGEDTNGNSLEEPLSVTVSIIDGVDQTATDIDEIYTETHTLSPKNPFTKDGLVFELGSDEIETIRFDADAIDQFEGLLSDNQSTQVSLSDDGKTLTLIIDGKPDEVVLQVTINENGEFSIEQNLPLEQNNAQDELKFAIPVTSIDHDGDVVTNVINYTVVDGSAPIVSVLGSVTPVEESQLDSGNPVLSQGSLSYQGSDAVQHFEIDVNAFNSQYQSVLKSDGLAVTLVDTTQNSDGFDRKYEGQDENGVTIFTIELQPNGSYSFELLKPLDHDAPVDANSADNNLFNLDFPVYGVDSDDDKSDSDTNTDGAQATILTIGVVDDISTLQDSLLFDQIVEPTVGVDGVTTAKQNVFTDVSQDGDQVTHFEYAGEKYILEDYPQNNVGEHVIPLSAVTPDDSGIGTIYISKDGDISFKPNSDILHTDATSTFDELTANLTVFTKDDDNDVDSVDVTLKIKDGDNISFTGGLTLAFTETQQPQVFTKDGGGNPLDIGMQVGSDHIASLKFIVDSDANSVLNNITLDEAPTFVHVIDDGQSVVVSLSSDSTDASSYVLQATFTENGDGERSGSYTVTQHQAFDQVDAPLLIKFPYEAQDTDLDVTAATIDVTVTDGANISVGEPNSEVELTEQLNMNGSQQNAISQHASIQLTQGSDEIDSVVWDLTPQMLASLAAITSQGQPTQYQVTDGLIRVYVSDDQNNQTDVITFELDDDKSGGYTVTQSLPIDNDTSDDQDLIVLSIKATDADGDSVNADIDVVLKDGVQTQVTASTLNYQEIADDFGALKMGTIDLKEGTDGVSDISVSLANINDVLNWTSQGTELDIVQDGNNYTLIYAEEPFNKVLEFIFDESDGSYEVIQYKPIDQDVSQISELNFIVTAKSTDDADAVTTIDVTIRDGVETTLSNSSVAYTEVKAGVAPEENYGFKADSVDLNAGVDGVERIEVLLDEAATVGSWTSQGNELQVIQDGNDFKLTYLNDPDNVVLEFVFDDDSGDYSIEQLLPLDQINGESSVINLTVNAYSTDDEVTSAKIAITISDGAETTLENRTVNLTETDDADDSFVKGEATGNVNLMPGVDGVSAIALTLSEAQVAIIEANWTSQGNTLSVVEDTDNNTYSLVYANDADTEVVKVTLDDDGNYTVEQLLPIDQDGATNTLTFEVTASSTDDVDVTKTLTVNIHDGVDTTLNDDTVNLRETLDDQGAFTTKLISGDVELNPGPDGSASTITLANTATVEAWTSNGQPTTIETTDTTITLLDGDGEKVLELIYYPQDSGMKQAGTYDVIQYAAIDQLVDDVNTLLVDVTATSTDDASLTKRITVNIEDGTTPSIAAIDPITLTETSDMSAATPAAQTYSGLLDINSGTDALKTVFFELDDSSAVSLAGLRSEGRELEVKSEDGSYTLLLKGTSTEVLNISLDKDSGDVTVEQYLPLDNPVNNNLVLTLKAKASDTDGDSGSNTFELTLVDGQDPRIEPIASMQVFEAGIGEASDDSEADSTSITFAPSSDNVKTIEIKASGIVVTDQNDAPVTLTSDNQVVQYQQTATGLIGFIGSGVTKEVVFEATVNSDYTDTDFGKVEFTLLKEVGHPNAGNDALKLKLPVVATDFDNDPSQSGVDQAYLTVSLVDDVSTLKQSVLFDEIVEPVIGTQGSITATQNIFSDVSKDGDQVTHITYENRTYRLDDFSQNADQQYEIPLEAVSPDDTGIGTIYITRDGDIAFKPNSDILHTDSTSTNDVITAILQVFTQDGDGDTDSVDVTLKIKDGDNIDFNGVREVAWTETSAIQTITQDGNGQILNVGLTSGSDELKSLKFVADDDTSSVLNNITVDGVATYVHIINGGDSVVISTNPNSPLAVADYVLQATLSKDAQGKANGEYSLTQYKPFDQSELPTDSAEILFPLVATDTDDDPTPTTIKVTVTDGQDITFANSDSKVELTETLTLDGSDNNAISQHDSVMFAAGVDGIDSIAWQDNAALRAMLDSITTQGQATEYSVSNDTIRVYVDDQGQQQDVITFVLDNGTAGGYTVTQYLPIDNSNDSSTNMDVLNLAIVATDNDGDETVAGVKVTLQDGVNTSLANASEELTETDNADDEFVVATANGNVSLVAGADGISNLAVNLSTSDKNAIEANWTSQGKALKVEFDSDENIYTLVYKDAPNTEVFEFKLNDDGSYNIKQSLPIDQVGEKSTLVFNVIASSTDDADLSATVTVDIKDGIDTSIEDSSEQLTETLDAGGDFTPSSVGGDTQLNPGPDGAQTTISLANYDEVHGTAGNNFKGWSSNGNDIVVSQTDTTVTLTDSVTGDKVLELTYYPTDVGMIGDANYKQAGTYDVTQFKAIDQPLTNISQLKVLVTSTSTDDDPQTANITIDIVDGTTPTIDSNNDAELTETANMTSNTPASDTFLNMLSIESGTDAIDTVMFDLTPTSVYQLADLTSSGQELEVKSEDASYSLVIKGTNTEVLNIALNKETGAITVDQSQPLDNPLGNVIELTLSATATDTDGDSDSTTFKLDLIDGQDPAITTIGKIEVDEKGIGISKDKAEIDSTEIKLAPSSDNIKQFNIDTDAIAVFDKDGDPIANLTSDGLAVQFSYNQNTGVYLGYVVEGNKNKTVFELKVNSDYTDNDFGKVEFKMLRGLDHPDAGSDLLTIKLPVTATDFDGDTSAAQILEIAVTDKVSDAKDVTIDLVEGQSSPNNSTVNLVNFKQGDRIDDIDIEVPAGLQNKFAFGDPNNPVFEVDFDALDDGVTVLTKDSDGNWQSIGDLSLFTKGSAVRVDFDSASSIDHVMGKVQAEFLVTTTDNDGDIDTANLKINISDKNATLEIEQVRGDEDAAEIPVDLTLKLHDADLETITQLDLEAPQGGDFYYYDPQNLNGTPIMVTGSLNASKLVVSPQTLEFGSTTEMTIDNIVFIPDAEFATNSSGFKVDADVTVERADHTTQVRSGEVHIIIDGVADKPTITGDFEATATGSEDSLIKLNFEFETQDQTDASAEAITYQVKLSDADSAAGHRITDSNGTEFSADDDGIYHFTAAQIDDVYLAAKGDYSGSVTVEVTATSHEPFNNSTNSTDKSIVVDVTPVVDPISFQVERVKVNEDTEFKLKDHVLVNDLTDTDGSEARFVYLKDLPDGSVITNINSDGDTALILGGVAYLVDDFNIPSALPLDVTDPIGDDLDANVDLVIDYALIESGATGIFPPKDSNDNFTFDVEVKVVDSASFLVNSDVAVSQSMGNKTIAVDVKGIADAPEMTADSNLVWEVVKDNDDNLLGIKTSTALAENGEITLDFGVMSGETQYDMSGPDGSETVSVVIYAAADNLGEYTIVDSNNDEVSLTYVGSKNGSAQYEADIAQGDIKVIPKPNNTEDIHLIAKIIVTEDDGNELVTEKDIFIEVNPEISGFMNNFVVHSDDASSTPLEDRDNNVKWYPGKLTDREGGNDHEFVSKLVISGNQGESNAVLTGVAMFIQDSTAIGEVLINGMAAQATNGKYEFSANDSVMITAKTGYELTAGNLKISALVSPEDSSADFVLDSTVYVTEIDVDSIDTNTGQRVVETVPYNGKLNVDVKPVVETDSILDITGIASGVTEQISDGIATFTINGQDPNATYSINLDNKDIDSLEEVSQVVVDFGFGDEISPEEQAILDQIYVQGAINNGDGTWTVTNETSFSIQAPDGVLVNGSPYELDVIIRTLAVDHGIDSENEISAPARRDSTPHLDLKFAFEDPSPGQEVGTAASSEDGVVYQVAALEDTPIVLDDVLRSQIIITDVGKLNDGAAQDQITIVFDMNDIDVVDQVSSGSGEENFANGKYAFTIDPDMVNGDGTLKVGALGNATISLIDHFAGDFTIPISIVITDPNTGDENVINQSIDFIVAPEVDGVERVNNGPVVQTVEADDFTAGEEVPTPISANTAYEDIQVALNLNQFDFIDPHSNESHGVESFSALTITPSSGSVSTGTNYASGVEDNGDGSITITAANLPVGISVQDVLQDVMFAPDKDFSGNVNLAISGEIVDTTDNAGTDTEDFNTSITVDVASIVDGVTANSLGNRQITGDEDGAITLEQLDFTLDDSDGSEEFVSFKLTDVPEDFIVESTSAAFVVANNGSGEWSIKLTEDVGQSVDLSAIQVIPAANFSGTANMGYVVFTQEQVDKQPKAQQGTIALTVNPMADEVDTRIDNQATGIEASGAGTGVVDITIDARIVDKTNSIAASNKHSENDPETVYIKVDNIPDGVSVVLPGYTDTGDLNTGDYIAYQEIANGNYTGSWIVETNLQQVTAIQLDLTGTDYNSDAWANDNPQITVNVSANDNGVIGNTDTQVIDLDITPVNDKPEVSAQTNYSTDEDVPLSITSIQIADADVIDAPNTVMTVTISHTSGTLSFSSDSLQYANDNTVLISTDNNGNMVLNGTIEHINTLLNGDAVASDKGLLFSAGENSHQDAQIKVWVTDNGNNGDVNDDGVVDINDALTSDEINIDVTVNAVNDAPTVAGSLSRETDEDTAITLTDIQIADVDEVDNPSANMTVTLSSTLGAISFVADDNSVMVSTNINGDTVLNGTLGDINTWLAQGVIYTPDANVSGDAELNVVVNDNGNFGSGGPQQNQDFTVAIKVTPISDQPNLDAERNRYVVAVNDAQVAVIPLLGLIPALSVATESLAVQFDNVPAGAVIKVGAVAAVDIGNGMYQAQVPPGGDTDISVELQPGVSLNSTNIEVRAVSTDQTAAPALSDPVTLTLSTDASNTVTGSSEDEYIINVSDQDGITLLGGDGDDIIIGSDGDDIIRGGEGDDRVEAGDGDDFVQGGLGNDHLLGGEGQDELVGGVGDDELKGGLGDDVLHGGLGADILTGGSGADTLLWALEDIDENSAVSDRVTDFNASKGVGVEHDTIDLSELFAEENSMDDILGRISANIDGDEIKIDILDEDGEETVQTIVLENQAGYTLDAGSGSLAEDLINNDFIKLPNIDQM